jgi:hypothetical protein
MAAFTFLMVVSNRPQQGVAGPGGAVDPVPEKPIPMPPGLIGLEIALGQDGLWAQAWQGEVRMSEGRVLSLEVLQRSLRARVDGPLIRDSRPGRESGCQVKGAEHCHPAGSPGTGRRANVCLADCRLG